MRKLYIIAGCNGAGKTTASYTMLPELLHCHEFVNADEIARGLSPFNPDSMAIEAGRLMLRDNTINQNIPKVHRTSSGARILCVAALLLATLTRAGYRACG